MKIKIITDSASDIPRKFAKENDITILPLSVTFGTENYLDGVDLSIDDFYKKMRYMACLPKTSQVNEYTFSETLRPYLNTDTLIIILLLGSKMSNTFNSAKSAVQNLKMENQVILIDTRQVTYSEGYIVMETAKLIKDSGITQEMLIDKINFFIEKVKFLSMIDNLSYLQKGGRLSPASATLGNMLHIKPIISIRDNVDVVSKQIGIAKSMRYMIDMIKNRNTDYPICFGHSDCRAQLDCFIHKVGLEIILSGKEEICDIGATVGVHAGPGCFGVCYMDK